METRVAIENSEVVNLEEAFQGAVEEIDRRRQEVEVVGDQPFSSSLPAAQSLVDWPDLEAAKVVHCHLSPAD